MFVKLTKDPTYSTNFKSYVALAPVAYADHISAELLRLLIDFHLEDVWEIFGDHKFFFLSHEDVSPLYGMVIGMIPGITIDLI